MALNKDGLEAGQTVTFEQLMKIELNRKVKNASESGNNGEQEKKTRGRKKSGVDNQSPSSNETEAQEE